MEKKLTFKAGLDTRKIVIVGMLSAISIILGFTPLGYIPLPPINPTIMHIPVVIGAILEGPLVGALIGLIFGLSSIAKAITNPSITSFMFFNPLVSVLPRIIIGIASYYVYKVIFIKKDIIKIGIAAFVGSLTNTVLVLGAIYFIYLESFASALNVSSGAARNTIFSIALISGIPEAIICTLITVPVVIAIKNIRK